MIRDVLYDLTLTYSDDIIHVAPLRNPSHTSRKRQYIEDDYDNNKEENIKKRCSTVPKVIKSQLTNDKIHWSELYDIIDSFRCILPHSDVESSSIQCDKMIKLVFIFDYSNIRHLPLLEEFKNDNVSVVAITPNYDLYNEQSFPIVLDKSGQVSKFLRLSNPVGGGIYPIPSVLLFDQRGKEMVRIRLGYDYNIHYDAVVNNLSNVLHECITFLENSPTGFI